jgi:hypothetical protein
MYVVYTVHQTSNADEQNDGAAVTDRLLQYGIHVLEYSTYIFIQYAVAASIGGSLPGWLAPCVADVVPKISTKFQILPNYCSLQFSVKLGLCH